MHLVKPYATNVVTFGMLLRGYGSAFGRFSAATLGQDAEAAYLPLFEALNWAVVLDDRRRRHWAPEGKPLDWKWRDRVAGAEVMSGVRWVRNSVHHQWSDALAVVDGVGDPVRDPITSFQWAWRPAADLPEPEQPDRHDNLAAYTRVLEGRPARVTLTTLGAAFELLWELLEMPRRHGQPGVGFLRPSS